LNQSIEGNIMKLRNALVASFAVLTLVMTTGCAVTRDQETMGAYIDDSVITTTVKSRFFDDKTVDGSAVSVETLNGTVVLSGFAKSTTEKRNAEAIALKVKGVKSVKNDLLIRP
jgi:osmotically-inducible protein OsmY